MKKPISRQAHGVIDYLYAVLVPLMPELAGFDQNEKAKMLCKLLGGGALAYTAVTKAEWGMIKLLPFKVHLVIDLTVSVFAAASPWLLGFSKNNRARNTLLAAGLAGIAASLLTEKKEVTCT